MEIFLKASLKMESEMESDELITLMKDTMMVTSEMIKKTGMANVLGEEKKRSMKGIGLITLWMASENSLGMTNNNKVNI